MKEHKKKIIITTLITLFPVIIGLAVNSKLPSKMPVHFDMSGTPDSYAGKYFIILGIPLMLTALHLFTIIITLHDPKKINISEKMLSLIFYTIPVISVVITSVTYIFSLGYDINISKVTTILIGILFIALGNYLTKTHQNYTVGIKLPWTLNNRENWNKTHRLGSRLFIIGGFVILSNIIFNSTVLFVAVIVIITIVPCIYSFILYKKGL